MCNAIEEAIEAEITAIMLDAAAGDERAAALLEKIKDLPLDQALDIIGEWRTNE